MSKNFTIAKFLSLFPTEDACIEEIKRLRYASGIKCSVCNAITKHYKIRNRTAYACEYCRHHSYPLKGTIFSKTSTPLFTWFVCMFFMTHTRGKISVQTLSSQLHVTYKTAWRMKQRVKNLMKQNGGDLLSDNVITVTFFNAFEVKVTQKKLST